MISNGHPNAFLGGVGGGIGGGALAVYALHRFGVDITDYEGALIAGGISTLVLFVGRNGLQGLLKLVWGGSKK